MNHLQYPIGKYNAPENITPEHIQGWIAELETLPDRFRKVAESLSEEQLETPYRPQGWTARQVIHHTADSHIGAYIRFRWGMTEDNPTIKPYDEVAWAKLSDAHTAPIEPSLAMLDSLHQRMVLFLKSLSFADLQRTYFHPQQQKTVTLAFVIGMYAWHGNHHLAHLSLVK